VNEPDAVTHLAHDLRSPLAIVKGAMLQLLHRTARHGPLSERQRGILQIALRSALLLEDAVDEVLVMHLLATPPGERLEAGARTDLRDVFFTAIPQVLCRIDGTAFEIDVDRESPDAVRSHLAEHGITIDAGDALLAEPLEVHRLALVRIVMNLVANALKHAPGPLLVRARRRAGTLEIAVVDRGPGPAEPTKRLREAPAPPPAARKKRPGLGLLGTRRLAELLGGSLGAEPGPEGVGTAMLVTIPRAFAEDAAT
jgi:signal transduction histidine kinase